MLKQSGTFKILNENRGASLVIVLGVMMLLLAISVSVYVAAGANQNSALNQSANSQISIIADSVQRNIMYSLQNEPESGGSMSGELVTAVYEANLPDGGAAAPADIELTMEIDGGFDLAAEGIVTDNITLSFTTAKQNVLVTKAEEAEAAAPGIPDGAGGWLIPPFAGSAGTPRTAEISAEMTVTVRLTLSADDRRITTRALYRYTGGRLIAENENDTDDNTQMKFDTDAFGDAAYGEWELIRYEKSDV